MANPLLSFLVFAICFSSSHSFVTRSSVVKISPKRSCTRLLSSSSDSYEKFRAFARSQFPFFNGKLAKSDERFDSTDWCFFDNAGGSQAPQVVVDASTDGMAVRWRDVIGSKHQLRAREVAAAVLGADKENIIFGSSASTLLRSIALGYSQLLQPGDEIVVCDWAHESHVAPWILAAELSQAKIKWCHINRKGGGVLPSPSDIAKLCGPKTKIVTLTHVSNILGTVYDVKETTKLVKAVSDAAVIIDGVAFVPHMAPQVESIGCDWYVYSCYKAFGPHNAALYGSKDALMKLKSVSQNHKFIKPSKIGPERWELGTSNQEGAAAMAGLEKYFRSLVKFAEGEDSSKRELHEVVEAAYGHMHQAEHAVGAKFLDYLSSNPRVTVLGKPTMEDRVPTISLIHSKLKAKDVYEAAKDEKIICRYGVFQSPRLLETLRVPEPYTDGVLRFSFVHYNTIQDVERIIHLLDKIGF